MSCVPLVIRYLNIMYEHLWMTRNMHLIKSKSNTNATHDQFDKTQSMKPLKSDHEEISEVKNAIFAILMQ